jgi:hypothetical protein
MIIFFCLIFFPKGGIMKKLALTAAMALLLGFAGNAQAATISLTLPEFNGDYYSVGPYPYYTVGTYSYTIPAGEKVVSAKISGQWGNSTVTTTANNTIDLDGIEVADTYDFDPPPYSTPVTLWSYVFAPSQLGIFADGSAVLGTQMTSEYVIRMGETNLELTTAPCPVPEPTSMVLGLLGIGGALGLRRKK